MSTLRSRLLFMFGIALAAGLAALSFMMWGFIRGRMDDDLDSQLRSRAFALSRIVDVRRPRFLPYIEQGLEMKPEGFFAQLFDAEGKLIDKSSNLTAEVALSEVARRISPERTEAVVENVHDERGRRLRMAAMARSDYFNGARQSPIIAQVGIPLERHQERLRQMVVGLITVAGGIWVVAMLLVGLLLRHWFQALRALEQSAAGWSPDKLTRQRVLVPKGDAEIAGLAKAVNRLLDQVEAAHSTQQRFVADASHELRTPLTILRGEIEVALRRPRAAEEYREVLQSNKEEIERLSRLTENLLLLARADAGQALISQSEVDVSAAVKDMAAKLAPVAAERGVTLTCEAPATAMLPGDRLALERVFFNLIDNAVSYSPAGESVGLRVEDDGATVSVTVTDVGQGIPAEHLPHLFERFYRADPSRSREHGGAGLGLAIVKTFVEAHGGTVGVLSEIGRGSQFWVGLPRAVPR